MPMRTISPPSEALEAIARAMTPVASPPGEDTGFRARAEHQAEAADRPSAFEQANPVYLLGLNSMLADRPLDEARLAGWRFLVRTDRQRIVAASVSQSPNGAFAAAPTLNLSGPNLDSSRQLYAELMRSATSIEADYELRLLRIPALYLWAFWLYSPDRATDRFACIAPTPPAIEPAQLYTFPELIALLRPSALVALEANTNAR
jgi:hypothetical protein